LRTSPSLHGLDRIDTVIQDETGKNGAIEIPLDARPVRDLVTQDDGACPFISGIRLQWQFKDQACGVLARHSSRNYEEVRMSSRGVWDIALAGDALSTPGINAGHVAAFRSRWANLW
jgi:hypothetical protein